MNRSYLLPVLFVLLLGACDTRQAALTESEPPDALSALRSSSSPGISLDSYEAPTVHLVRFGKKIPDDFASTIESLGGSVYYSHAPTGIAILHGLSDEATSTVANLKDIADFIADASYQLDTGFDANSAQNAGVTPASAANPTAASFYARQWDMIAIGADKAWASGRLGSPNVTIAILDSGIDYTYPDLAGKVDLSRSVSFVPSDDALVNAFFPGRNLITDLRFHGTHVAMTASSNSDLLAGVTTQTTLMGVKVCNVNGSCAYSSVIAGVLHAADSGADVANLSLGGEFPIAGNGEFLGFLNRVFTYANSKRLTVVVSAGNAASDLDHNGGSFASFCNSPNVICASATAPEAGASTVGPWTNVDAIAGYTNFGSSAISVAAPGGLLIANSAGWVWSGCSQTSLVIPTCQTGIFILGASGTSMSSPHVTGLAALLIEDLGKQPGRIKTAIQNSADDLGRKGTDPFYGKGRINVAEALDL